MDNKILVGSSEAAAALGIGKTLFYSMHLQRKIPAPIKLGRRTLWRRQELEEWAAHGCPNRPEWEKMKKGQIKGCPPTGNS